MATILKIHEQHNTKNRAVSQQMAQYVNALITENEKQTVWIRDMMKESQAQTEVLRQHHVGQQVLAGVIKSMANNQQAQPPQQFTAGITAGH